MIGTHAHQLVRKHLRASKGFFCAQARLRHGSRVNVFQTEQTFVNYCICIHTEALKTVKTRLQLLMPAMRTDLFRKRLCARVGFKLTANGSDWGTPMLGPKILKVL
jgi:hypothetical protein